MKDNNKHLLNEIDELDDNEEPFKVKNEKISSHEKIFTIIIILIIIIALIVLYLFYKGTYIVSNKTNKQDDFSSILDNLYNDSIDEYDDEFYDDHNNEEYFDHYKEATEKFETQKNNLTITSQTLDIDGKLIITLHNGNQEIIYDFLVEVIFYDGDNKPIKIDGIPINAIEANSDYYILFENTPKEYTRCDFLITKDYNNNIYISHKNDITFSVQENVNSKYGKNVIEITGKNNSDDTIEEINFAILFYDENNKIIALKNIYESEIKKQKNFKIDTENAFYSSETYENIPYNRYEVILLDAISYNEN